MWFEFKNGFQGRYTSHVDMTHVILSVEMFNNDALIGSLQKSAELSKEEISVSINLPHRNLKLWFNSLYKKKKKKKWDSSSFIILFVKIDEINHNFLVLYDIYIECQNIFGYIEEQIKWSLLFL